MKKTEQDRKIFALHYKQFVEVRTRNEVEGMRYAQAAIAAYKTVYMKEGK
jgi:hypothetical protein